MYLRQYWVDVVFSWIFEIAESTANRLHVEFVQTFAQIASSKLILPTKEERLANSVKFRDRLVVGVFDGFEQQVVNFVNKVVQELFYSVKKKKSTVNTLVGCDPLRGKLLWFSQPFWGSIPDAVAMRFVDALQLSDDECAMADKGFNTLPQYYSNYVLPFKHNPYDQLTEREEEINSMIAHVRIIIENYICQIKKHRCMSDKFRMKDTQEKVLESHHNHKLVVLYFLENYKMKNGIRNIVQ